METFKKLALESRTAGGQDSSSDTDAESDDTEAWPGLCLANEIAIEETQSVRDIGDFFDVSRIFITLNYIIAWSSSSSSSSSFFFFFSFLFLLLLFLLLVLLFLLLLLLVIVYVANSKVSLR